MRILFDPIVRNYSGTISATNASINYSANNIKHPFLRKRIQASTTSQVITIPFTVDQSADCLFYGIHNLSSLVAVFKNSGGGTVGTVTISSPDTENVNVEYFTQIDNIRSIEVTITTASSYAKLGGFECGVYYQMPYAYTSYPSETIDNSRASKSGGGQVTVDDITKLRGFGFKLLEVSYTIEQEIKTNYYLNGKRPCYIDLFETDGVAIYATIEKPISSQRNENTYAIDLEIQEAF